ncbi:MAG: thermonuclease family protein [Nanoarchaeota archaeon]
MNKKHAFILALLITILLANTFFVLNIQSQKKSKETKILARVIDGDTIKTSDGQTIRLLNINTPEKGTINAELSKQFLGKFLNQSIQLEIIGYDKYKRLLARIYTSTPSQVYLNLELVKLGLSSKFLVDNSELTEFANAEDNAIKKGIGIWNHSAYFSCFKSKILPKEEKVILESTCSQINLNLWYLKDESRKTYFFKNISLSGAIKLAIHSNEGKDNTTDIFWNSKTDIWNNDCDSLYLFDSGGNIAHYESYCY